MVLSLENVCACRDKACVFELLLFVWMFSVIYISVEMKFDENVRRNCEK